jgi:solute carrier family 25 S-adenosylmethionine transporter 26
VKSFVAVVEQIFRIDGWRGFFTGYYATLVRDVPYTMLELGIYENVKKSLRKFRQNIELSKSDELLAAALTGGITAFLTTPLDLIKTKLMMQVSSSFFIC